MTMNLTTDVIKKALETFGGTDLSQCSNYVIAQSMFSQGTTFLASVNSNMKTV